MTILQIEVSVKDTSVCIVDGTGKITREEIRCFSNNATITVAPADCWWRLRPAVRLQLATGPAVPERRVPPSVRRAFARPGLIQGLRECSSRWRTRRLFEFALCTTPVNET
jgi:hypothetical protein